MLHIYDINQAGIQGDPWKLMHFYKNFRKAMQKYPLIVSTIAIEPVRDKLDSRKQLGRESLEMFLLSPGARLTLRGFGNPNSEEIDADWERMYHVTIKIEGEGEKMAAKIENVLNVFYAQNTVKK